MRVVNYGVGAALIVLGCISGAVGQFGGGGAGPTWSPQDWTIGHLEKWVTTHPSVAV
jgi:hypothetical protein